MIKKLFNVFNYKIMQGILLIATICLLILLVVLRPPTAKSTPPRLEQCFRNLENIYPKLENYGGAEINDIKRITVLLREAEPNRCHYVWVGKKEYYCRQPILVKCCEHKAVLSEYERKRGIYSQRSCLYLLSNGHIVFACPCPETLSSDSKPETSIDN